MCKLFILWSDPDNLMPFVYNIRLTQYKRNRQIYIYLEIQGLWFFWTYTKYNYLLDVYYWPKKRHKIYIQNSTIIAFIDNNPVKFMYIQNTIFSNIYIIDQRKNKIYIQNSSIIAFIDNNPVKFIHVYKIQLSLRYILYIKEKTKYIQYVTLFAKKDKRNTSFHPGRLITYNNYSVPASSIIWYEDWKHPWNK